jgi:hypothetical protein
MPKFSIELQKVQVVDFQRRRLEAGVGIDLPGDRFMVTLAG